MKSVERKQNRQMKQFLRRMIKHNGFVASGVYNERPYFWYDNVQLSNSYIDILLFHSLKVNRYISKDAMNRYYPTEEGKDFAKPWYKRIWWLSW